METRTGPALKICWHWRHRALRHSSFSGTLRPETLTRASLPLRTSTMPGGQQSLAEPWECDLRYLERASRSTRGRVLQLHHRGRQRDDGVVNARWAYPRTGTERQRLAQYRPARTEGGNALHDRAEGRESQRRAQSQVGDAKTGAGGHSFALSVSTDDPHVVFHHLYTLPESGVSGDGPRIDCQRNGLLCYTRRLSNQCAGAHR